MTSCSYTACNYLQAYQRLSLSTNTFRQRVKDVVTGRGVQVGVECK